ncbi:hypothetical protein [Cryptosporidium parvum Iowa II]|uniref:TAP42-like protein n=2 Tax=Cryptosporidium parvum TaxID=5807 RepID=Q5CQA9_CRYPI|nr:hypothetical protein [Cryptosporidium parvum Iowa II]EAK87609.1 hypothetical protein cgd4_1430 [Cryptosporidium parvum Iowa II]QOY42032.1 TAP42-like protein [Cryptosporidium parvum]WKS77335.1 hypothetical protein CPCDC_4g1430 [Cryptosporidium sp. 43IA8]WRK31994.1 TAP42-like protein [Cryptosporidium parvum]|eukprot:QOY42032.1 hypothetical protein CPATCC_001628 [Cryptosporidium parvum]
MDFHQISEKFLNLLKRYYKEIYDDFSESDLDEIIKLRDEILDFGNEIDFSNIISKNEEVEDLNTNDIKYLLYSYIKAETTRYVRDHNVPKERVERRNDLNEIMELYLQFFNNTLEIRNTIFKDTLDLVDNSQIKNLFIEESEKKIIKDTRQIKIMRFKKIKELKSSLSLFFKSGFNLTDESENRDMILKAINLFFLESIEQVSMINNEINILNYAIKEEFTKTSENGDKRYGDNNINNINNKIQKNCPPLNIKHIAPNIRYLTSKENTSNTGFTFKDINNGTAGVVINDRENFYSKVFGPSHTLPTISIAEAADMELKEALEQEKSSNIARKNKEERDQILHDKEYSKEEEEDELKARSWDDWKDLNPKGHGNTIRNRG